MEAGARICSRCRLRRLTEADCPACGSPTHLPDDPSTAHATAAGAALPAGTERARPAGAGALVGLLIALAAAVGLLASLFMPWYAVELPGGLRQLFESALQQFGAAHALPGGLEANAWEAFEVADLALAAAAALTAGLAAAVFAGLLAPRPALRALHFTGGFVAGLTLYRMVDQPEPAQLLTVQSGAWIALLAGLAIMAGSALAAARAR